MDAGLSYLFFERKLFVIWIILVLFFSKKYEEKTLLKYYSDLNNVQFLTHQAPVDRWSLVSHMVFLHPKKQKYLKILKQYMGPGGSLNSFLFSRDPLSASEIWVQTWISFGFLIILIAVVFRKQISAKPLPYFIIPKEPKEEAGGSTLS